MLGVDELNELIEYFGFVTVQLARRRTGLTSVSSWTSGRARLVAVCESVLVHYDYGRGIPMPVPDDVAAQIEAFEGRPLRDPR